MFSENNLQSMDHEISQQPTCSKSAQNIEEPQKTSTSANTNGNKIKKLFFKYYIFLLFIIKYNCLIFFFLRF